MRINQLLETLERQQATFLDHLGSLAMFHEIDLVNLESLKDQLDAQLLGVIQAAVAQSMFTEETQKLILGLSYKQEILAEILSDFSNHDPAKEPL